MASNWKTSLAIAVALTALPAVGAGPQGFDAGVRAYNTRQYSQAVGYFRQAAAAAPTNPLVHYYLGLSYQGMNQMTLAQQEFSWVASTQSSVSAQARAALANLSKYSRSYAGSGYTGSATARNTKPAASMTMASAAPTQKANGRLQIVYFYIDG